MRKLFITVLLFCVTGSVHVLYAQVGITAVPLLQFNNHARSMGLGGSTVALRYHNAGAHVNPAVIGNPGHVELTTQFHKIGGFPYYSPGIEWLPEFSQNMAYYRPSVSVSKDRWSFSYQLAYFKLGEQRHRGPGGEPLGTFNSNEQAHTLTAAYRWNDYFSFGAGLNFIRSKLAPSGIEVGDKESQVGTAVSLDLGVYGEYPWRIDEDIRLTSSGGWSLTDFGSMIKYSDDAEGDPLPMMMRLGLGLQMEYTNPVEDVAFLEGRIPVSVAYYRSFEKLMVRTDLSGNAMGPFQALFNSWDTYRRDIGFETKFYTLGEQIDHRGGLEIVLFEMLSFRQGYSREAEVNGGRKMNFFGFGLHYSMFILDYVRQERDGVRSRISSTQKYWQLSISFSTDRVQKWLN